MMLVQLPDVSVSPNPPVTNYWSLKYTQTDRQTHMQPYIKGLRIEPGTIFPGSNKIHVHVNTCILYNWNNYKNYQII